jgi:hypothetical protein
MKSASNNSRHLGGGYESQEKVSKIMNKVFGALEKKEYTEVILLLETIKDIHEKDGNKAEIESTEKFIDGIKELSAIHLERRSAIVELMNKVNTAMATEKYNDAIRFLETVKEIYEKMDDEAEMENTQKFIDGLKQLKESNAQKKSAGKKNTHRHPDLPPTMGGSKRRTRSKKQRGRSRRR